MRNLLSLPVELLVHILSYLDAYDLLNCSAVTKHLSRLISTSSRLQYTITLAKNKLLAVLPDREPYPPYATHLRVLKEREKAWKELKWRGRRRLKLPPTGSVYEFVGGIYGNGSEDENRVTASISFLELPTCPEDGLNQNQWNNTRQDVSEINGPNARATGAHERKLKTWSHFMGDLSIIDFTMDPSQDLLALVALAPNDSKYIYNLHLRTISTNEPHPNAQMPILFCLEKHSMNPLTPELFAAVRVQVSGDLVGLLIKEAPYPVGAHLEIWNWENDPSYSCSMSSSHGIDDFTFLSHSAFLIVLPIGRFEVYTFPDPLTTPPQTIVSPYSSSSRAWPPPISSASGSGFSRRGGCSPVRKYSYDFPELSPGHMYWYISMSCNPAPGYVPSQSGRAVNPFPPPSSTCYDLPSPSTAVEGDTNDDQRSGSGHGGMPLIADDCNNENNEHANQQLYYPLPDERIHACCVYIFNPNSHTDIPGVDNLNLGINNSSPTTTSTAATLANGTGSPSTTHHTPASSSNLTNSSPNISNANHTHVNGNNISLEDDVNDETQHVHSFVFFLNLKTLLNPPEEWFRIPEPPSTTPPGSPFAALTIKLGPVWKAPVALSHSDSTSGSYFGSEKAGMAVGNGETSGAAALESSLNALQRRQEEKELRDAKAALDAHAIVNAKKQKKRNGGGLSSSLSFEIPLEGPSGGVSFNSMSLMSPLNRSLPSPKPLASSSSAGPAYPPFPTFSSPYRFSSPSNSGPRNNTSPGGNINTKPTPLGRSSSSGSTSTLPLIGDMGMSSLQSPGTLTGGFSRPRATLNEAKAGPNQPSVTSAFDYQFSSGPLPAPSSANSVSSGNMRSASTPPGLLPSAQINNRSPTDVNTPLPTRSPKVPRPMQQPSTPTLPSAQYQSQDQNHSNEYHHRSTSQSRRNPNQPIPWDVWGPSSTRWFEECLSTDWQHAIYGLRTVESVRNLPLEKLLHKAQQREPEELHRQGVVDITPFELKEARLENKAQGIPTETKGNSTPFLEGNRLMEKTDAELQGKNPRVGIRPQKHSNLNLVPQAIPNSGTNEKVVKGEGTEDEKHLGEGKELEIYGDVEMTRRRTNVKAKQKADTNANPKLLYDDETVLEEKEPLQPSPSGDPHLFSPEEEKSQCTTLYLPIDGSSSSGISLQGGWTLNEEDGRSETTTIGISPGCSQSPTRSRRFLRVRDFNPYAIKLAESEAEAGLQNLAHTGSMASSNLSKSKGKQRALPSPSPPQSPHSDPYPIQLGFHSSLLCSPFPIPDHPEESIIQHAAPRQEANGVWGRRRVIREPSITPVRGVFKKDIVSRLPYTEVVSEETFEVTDVMMDDCRLLLLKRGQMGKLESVEVLIM